MIDSFNVWAAEHHTLDSVKAREIVARLLTVEGPVSVSRILEVRDLCLNLRGCPGSVHRALSYKDYSSLDQEGRKGVLKFVAAQLQRQLVCNGLRVLA